MPATTPRVVDVGVDVVVVVDVAVAAVANSASCLDSNDHFFYDADLSHALAAPGTERTGRNEELRPSIGTISGQVVRRGA